MSTEIPDTVNAADVTDWSDEVDVVVIGFGIAGGCAAVSAAAAGARVLVLERAAAAGGTSVDGRRPLLSRRRHRGAAGDRSRRQSPTRCTSTWSRCRREPDHEKIRAYCDGSVEHFNWLEDLGFQFERSYYPGKVVVPPGTEGLSYTGNEKVWPFCEQAKPAPRGHSVPVPGELGGASMVIDLLVKRADELGVQIRYETGVTNLIVDDGAVVGVRWKHFTETGADQGQVGRHRRRWLRDEPRDGRRAHARARSEATHQAPRRWSSPTSSATRTTTGSASGLGVSAGGVAKNLDGLFITAAAYPPEILLTGVIVNNQGKRFVAEDSYHSRTSAFVLEQPDQTAYLIVDEAHMQMPEMPLIKFIDGWETVEEMETALGIPEGKLAATLDRYNENAAKRRGPRLPQAAGIRCGPGQRTVGGVRPVAGRGDVLRIHHGRTWRCRSTARCSARTAASSPGCTRRARARRTSPRTARATPAAPNWARARSSAAARARTRPRDLDGASVSRQAPTAVAEQLAVAGRGAVRRGRGG